MRSQYAGLLAAAASLVSIIIAALYYKGYDPFTNYLSDMGVGASAVYFNGGLILSGVLGIVFAFYLGQKFKSIGTKIFTIAAADLILIGIFTEAYPIVHYVVSAIFFVTAAISILILGARIKGLHYFSFICAFLALGVLTTLPIMEHVAVAAIVIWLAVISLSVGNKK